MSLHIVSAQVFLCITHNASGLILSQCHRFLLYPLVVSLPLGTCSFHPSTHLCPSVHSFEHPSILPSIYSHKPICLSSTQTAVLALTHHPLTHLYVRTYARTYPSSSQLSVTREGRGFSISVSCTFIPRRPGLALSLIPSPCLPPPSPDSVAALQSGLPPPSGHLRPSPSRPGPPHTRLGQTHQHPG